MKTNEAQVHELVLDLTNPEKVGYCFCTIEDVSPSRRVSWWDQKELTSYFLFFMHCIPYIARNCPPGAQQET